MFQSICFDTLSTGDHRPYLSIPTETDYLSTQPPEIELKPAHHYNYCVWLPKLLIELITPELSLTNPRKHCAGVKGGIWTECNVQRWTMVSNFLFEEQEHTIGYNYHGLTRRTNRRPQWNHRSLKQLKYRWWDINIYSLLLRKCADKVQ